MCGRAAGQDYRGEGTEVRDRDWVNGDEQKLKQEGSEQIIGH